MNVTTLETLEAEWHELNPKPFSAYGRTSHIRALWKCSICNHEWKCSKANRTSGGSGCPECRKLKFRGNKNPKWGGYGEIGARQWFCIETEANRHREIPIPFEITIEYIWELFLAQDRKCVFTGETISMWGKKDGKMEGTASLDRIDSLKGYVDGNVQWVHKQIQHVKRNWKDEDFIALCQKVAAYQTKKELEQRGIPSFKQWKEITT